MSSPSVPARIAVAVDAAIFTIVDDQLCLLLIQMKKTPYTGQWAMPGGRLDPKETAEAATMNILRTQTGVENVYLEQLKTFDAIDRDSLERVVSIASMALIASSQVSLHTTDKYSDVRWWPVKKLPALAYDHKQVAKEAVLRLKSKIQYSNIVYSLLEPAFTLSELQRVYEIILGTTLDKRNFRKRILSLDLIKPTGKKTSGGASRPAELYAFKQRKPEYIDMI